MTTSSSPSRRKLLHELLEEVCRSVRWSPQRGRSHSATLADALAKQTIRVSTPDVELRAHVTADAGLELVVRASAWSASAEEALRDELERQTSLVARLVQAEWTLVRVACKAAHRADRTLRMKTAPGR